jgi:predicted negative regulator of RcsB-dependent stress response
VDAYRTDEEQIESIKRWWKDYGNQVLIGIGLAVAAIFGWQMWQDHKLTTGEAASRAYLELIEAVQSAPPGQSAEERLKAIQYLSDKIRTEHGSTHYALLARLLEARFLAEQNKLPEAEKQLREVIDARPGAALQLIAQQRLARVLMMQGQHEQALKLVESIQVSGAQSAVFEEIKGDIHLALGNPDQARLAYQKAQAAQLDEPNRILKLKLDDLAAE